MKSKNNATIIIMGQDKPSGVAAHFEPGGRILAEEMHLASQRACELLIQCGRSMEQITSAIAAAVEASRAAEERANMLKDELSHSLRITRMPTIAIAKDGQQLRRERRAKKRKCTPIKTKNK